MSIYQSNRIKASIAQCTDFFDRETQSRSFKFKSCSCSSGHFSEFPLLSATNWWCKCRQDKSNLYRQRFEPDFFSAFLVKSRGHALKSIFSLVNVGYLIIVLGKLETRLKMFESKTAIFFKQISIMLIFPQ